MALKCSDILVGELHAYIFCTWAMFCTSLVMLYGTPWLGKIEERAEESEHHPKCWGGGAAAHTIQKGKKAGEEAKTFRGKSK